MHRQPSESDSFFRQHRCLRGLLHLNHGMKLLIVVGVAAIAALIVAEALYFRRSLFVMIVPTIVTLLASWAVYSQKRVWLKPIIGISYFHMFLATYLLLIFCYFFFFKPLYIIMVLNWAFDTLYTKKTVSYYVQCFCIFFGISLFGLFNAWQLAVVQAYADFLDLVSRPESSTGITELSEKREPVVLVVNRNPSDGMGLPRMRDYRLGDH